MANGLNGTSLGGYGREIYKRYHYTCVYCGFDGRVFDNWMQLSIDHIFPRNHPRGADRKSKENMVVACRACNSITSRMEFPKNATREDILREKRAKVAERRKVFYDQWSSDVAPSYLERPLPKLRKQAT
ncbi:HNH endonuclease [Casimicrobium huifangae]|uniref:HNH endonuclease n=1 Tax=Casimicrobium huifangae TaxID=2591109 RepID=UPI0013969F0F|nr:HNH endonuclease [Casimicrobium huifangae]